LSGVEDPIELEFVLPLYSPTFLRYYLERSNFKDIDFVGSLRDRNKEMLTFYESKPTSEQSREVLENIEKYRENQAILDILFPIEHQQ
jgi:hypothetical protein